MGRNLNGIGLRKPLIRRRVLPAVLSSSITLLLIVASIVSHLLLTPEQIANSMPLSTFILVLSVATFLCIIASILHFLQLKPKFHRHPKVALVTTIVLVIITRIFSIHFAFPKLLYSSTFFSQYCYTLFGQPHALGELVIDASLLLFISMLSIKYLFIYRYGAMWNHKGLFWFLFSAFLLGVLLLFPLFVTILDSIAYSSDIVITPERIMFFNAHSFGVIFVFFSFSTCYITLQHRALQNVYYIFQHKTSYFLLFCGIAFALECLVILLFFPKIGAFTSVFILIAQFTFILGSVLFILMLRNRSQFVMVAVTIVLFSALAAQMLSKVVTVRSSEQRDKFLTELLEEKELYNQDEGLDNEVIDSIYNSVYQMDKPVLGNDWIVKSPKHLNRSYLTENSQLPACYAFAYMVDGRLVDQFGMFDYQLTDEYYPSDIQADNIPLGIYQRGYIHYPYQLNAHEKLIVSERKETSFDFSSAFALYFIAYMFLYMVVAAFISVFLRIDVFPRSLYNNLLWTSLVALLVISLIGSVLSLVTYSRGVKIEFQERARATMAAVQRSFIRTEGGFERVSKVSPDSISACNRRLRELSRDFHVQINLFDKNGKLFLSSDKQALRAGLQFPQELKQHFALNYSYYFSTIREGDVAIHTIYKVIVDQNGATIGYASCKDVKNAYIHDFEKSIWVSKYLRLYSLMILLSFLASSLICFFVSRSMRSVRQALAVRRGMNSPIRLDWVENEEIGKLIREHNRLVEELRKDAEQLAKSARETAWRDMAQEVAHEIKNPLTPMRLKMQMLERAWKNQRPDFDQRLTDTTEEILHQVDVLTEVADIFSQFASTQQSINRIENLKMLLLDFQSTLNGNLNTNYSVQINESHDCHAMVDKKLFRLMLENLVMNADNNRNENGKLSVEISLQEDADPRYWMLHFAANDRGLDEENLALVFTVQFSSSNCGYSLCLPIVKNIVVGFQGEISFKTEKNVGTEFFIKIPKY